MKAFEEWQIKHFANNQLSEIDPHCSDMLQAFRAGMLHAAEIVRSLDAGFHGSSKTIWRVAEAIEREANDA